MADQVAICEATLACHQVFRDLCVVPTVDEWAESCLVDFNLWAKGAGALRVGKASLDARLSTNLDAKIFLINLLRMLQGFLEKCAEIGKKVQNNTPGSSDLSEAITDVKDTLRQLSRITISIRRAGTNARIQKADASYDPGHPQVEALSQHLQLLLLVKPSESGTLQARSSSQGIVLYSCANNATAIESQTLTAIQHRLIEANLKRRNRFLYAQRHAMKLSERDQVLAKSIAAPQSLSLPPALDAFKGSTEEHKVARVYSTTTATEIQDPIALPTHVSAQPATTVISAISSRVAYPRPPPLRGDQNVFQCPCCCQTLPTYMSKGSQWKKHLSKDILPYTCILKNCPDPEKLYHTKNLWLSHMFTNHGGTSNWICLACNDSTTRPVFFQKSAFIEHLEERHSSGIKPQQIPILVSAWKRKMSMSIHSCPLCGFEDLDSDTVLNHTAEHLHSFAIRSLPWAPGENESGSDFGDDYFEEHPYFNTEKSDNTESERSGCSTSSEQSYPEDLYSLGSDGDENNGLTEGNVRDILENPDLEKDMLKIFLNGIEDKGAFEETSPLRSSRNLESVLFGEDEFAEAEAMYRRALQDGEKLLGPEHPDTLTSVTKLGNLLGNQGKYEEAEAMHRRALEGSEKVFGRESPHTLTIVTNLGNVLSRQGKYEEAETIHRRALEGSEKVLGPKHPDSLISVTGLGNVLYRQGKYEEAEAMYRRALEGSEKVLGPEHRDTLISLSNLGNVLGNQGRYEEAEAMHRRALEGSEKLLGPEHFTTLTSVSNLGNMLGYQGKYEEAEAMHRRALEGSEKVLGPEHPDTLISLSNLGNVLGNQGRYEEAEAMHRRALQDRERLLGPEHLNTLTSVSNLANMLVNQGKYEEAEAMNRSALEAKVLGREHPETLASIDIL